ncbi:MAG: TonB-dependent receptor, partial [Candidatus Eremiobacteraeota bacterium]|nr:TonB-dependent receptor [Candidatus Eremiobacteraeota bacterium]
NIITRPLLGNAAIKLADGSFGDRSLRAQVQNLTIERSVSTNDYTFGSGGIRSAADSELSAGRLVFAGGNGVWQTKLSASIVDHHLGDPGSVPLGFTTPSRENSVSRDLFASLTHRSSHAETTLELGAASQQFLFYCDNSSDPNCFTPSQALTTDARLQASLRNTVRFERSKLVYGIDLARGVARLDDGAGDVTTNAYAQAALYAEQTWLWGNADRAYAGIRAERDGAQGGIIAPAVGILSRLSPAVTLRANYATAFRAPSAEDLYFPGGFGNPQLQPERMRVADVRLDDASVLGGASIVWFSSKTTNKIVPDTNFVPQNIGHADIEGLTAEFKTPATHRLYGRINLTDLYRAIDATTNLRISAAGPVFSVSTELGFTGPPRSPVESWGLTTASRGAQYYAFSPAPAAGYTRIDAFVRFRFGDDALISLRVYNLGNHSISDVPGYPLPGRMFFIELATR